MLDKSFEIAIFRNLIGFGNSGCSWAGSGGTNRYFQLWLFHLKLNVFSSNLIQFVDIFTFYRFISHVSIPKTSIFQVKSLQSWQLFTKRNPIRSIRTQKNLKESGGNLQESTEWNQCNPLTPPLSPTPSKCWKRRKHDCKIPECGCSRKQLSSGFFQCIFRIPESEHPHTDRHTHSHTHTHTQTLR